MGNVLQLSLLAVAAAQLLHGAPRIIVLAVGLAGMFLPQLLLGLGSARHPRGAWIYFLLLVAVGALQSISTADEWPLLAALALAAALWLFLSIAPRLVAGISARMATLTLGLFLASTAYAVINVGYIEAVRSSAPPLALAVMVITGMACGRSRVLLTGAGLFVLLVLVWNSRAEALALFAYLATYTFLRSRGGLRKALSVALGVSVVALLVLSDYWAAALKLHDAYRGVGSGLTGRVTGFQYSAELIAERPLLGVGYRRQELYFEDAGFWVGRVEYPISSSHNGLLGILIEWGILGSLILLAPIMARARTIRESVRDSNALPVVVSFLAFIMFERYYINFGNLYSSIMIGLVVFWMRLEHDSRSPQPVGHLASRRESPV